MGTVEHKPDINSSGSTNGQKSGDVAWGKVATFLGAAASVVALLTWLGISSVDDLKVSVKPSATIAASHATSTATPNAESASSIAAFSETEESCVHALNIGRQGSPS